MEAELKNNEIKNKSFIDKFLNIIEKGGNALPHPATLFAMLAVAVVIISGIGGALGWSVDFVGINSKTMKTEEMVISTKSLMSKEGVNYIFTSIDRKSVVEGKSVTVHVHLGGGRNTVEVNNRTNQHATH